VSCETRLDRIEQILEQVTANQMAEARIRLELTQKLDLLTTHQELLQKIVLENSTAIQRNSTTIQQNSIAIDKLTQRLEQLTNRVDMLTVDIVDLTAAISDYVIEAETVREIITENQTEIKRIWKYLLGLHSNNGA
jgi:uncharacterized coiled-coil DUF342 family protein